MSRVWMIRLTWIARIIPLERKRKSSSRKIQSISPGITPKGLRRIHISENTKMSYPKQRVFTQASRRISKT
jgi:hypothetical protein